jgi:hypothetical protein
MFERQVVDRLNASGWSAWQFGQAQLPDECRQRLRQFVDFARRPSLIRWMPDIIALRDLSKGRSFVALIDAKTGDSDKPNYALELSAIETACIYTDQLYTPTFFVFADWLVLTPRDARQRGRSGPEPQPGRGSGTPYVLVSKQWGTPFDDIFPPVQTTVKA